ncbi:sensor histidine kinase [Heyndrickxia acidicola]|uniref:histidine kinase n=1 Tax=Heyndrickxia acidicola TaxID=209389 RepID=A0ABU6MM01_9BACI|nr:sensor histidine kinase [Heyndrickxia acidicola]MED1205432.1 sensor histidine kinase [Heyndrickxia acidicola]
MRFQFKLIVFIGILLLSVIAILVLSFQYMAASTLKQQIGERALNIAETVAISPDIIEGFQQQDPAKTIQPIAEDIRKKTGAQFVVVGNRQGIRYSHPDPDRIGEEMEGGNNQAVLKGHTILEEAVGTLGLSLRGKAPIIDQEGKVIGIVSVGFLTKEIDTTISTYLKRIIYLGIVAFIIGVLGTLFISSRVKNAILGLEPEEIGRLYQEKKAILESIREGIVSIDSKGLITMANQTACKMFGYLSEKELLGKAIQIVYPNSSLLKVLQTGIPEFDQQSRVEDQVIIINSLPVFNYQGKILGAVSSFRNKSELYHLIEELSHVKQYAEALRAQTHEYSNKLYMISGLLQLESYQEAIDFITRESDVHQNLIHFIMEQIPDPMIGGLLIGKFNRARELKVDLEIDRESSFSDVPESIDRNELITIIGNLIDNGIEAVLPSFVTRKLVQVSLIDLGKDLIIEIEDYGMGIPDEISDKIFDLGFSTKLEKSHGIGLSLVKYSIKELHGYLTFTIKPSGGTIFTVMIPKRKEFGVIEQKV